MQNRDRKFAKTLVITLFVLCIVILSVFQSKKLLSGPRLVVNQPQDGETVKNSLTEVSGEAQNISEIRLNGKKIFVDESGKFDEKVLLSYGYNIISVEVRDRFNRTEQKNLELILK